MSEKQFDPQGKAALYSNAARPEGRFSLECSSCNANSKVGLAKLGLLQLPVSFTIPFRYHHTWMRCPACSQRTWMRVKVF